MGLTIAVGLFAQSIAEAEDEAERAELVEPFRLLNEVLEEHGLAPHQEPDDITHEEYFEAEMFGYGGLHALRRLAAYLIEINELPLPMPYGEHSQDAVLHEVSIRAERLNGSRRSGLLAQLLRTPKQLPFSHLLLHSDAEGFYVPQSFEEVLIDRTEPQRLGLGMMVGSVPELLHECEMLATRLELPGNFDPDNDEFLDLLPEGTPAGAPWQRLPVEAHTVANLIRGCRASLRLSAALQFT